MSEKWEPTFDKAPEKYPWDNFASSDTASKLLDLLAPDGAESIKEERLATGESLRFIMFAGNVPMNAGKLAVCWLHSPTDELALAAARKQVQWMVGRKDLKKAIPT